MSTAGENHGSDKQLYWVADNIIASEFPPVEAALTDPDGLLAIGGELHSERILSAYRQGIFPWYSEGQPVLWWSPNPRCVLELDGLHISRSLARTLRRNRYSITYNRAFAEVIRACAAPRAGAEHTWLTEDMIKAYITLHAAGKAVSVECWHEGRLVGGLYGLVMGRIFFGESMFSTMSDASKVALVRLVDKLKRFNFRLLDCQVRSPHLQSLGATLMPRAHFTAILRRHCWPHTAYDWN